MMLNYYFYPILDIIFYPLFWLPGILSLSLVSLLAGFVLIGVYYLTSDQWAFAYWKEKLKTDQLLLLEGNYDVSVLKELLLANFQMFKLALVPAVCCILLVFSILPWAGSRFGYQPLTVNESCQVEVEASEAFELETGSKLRVSKNNLEFGPGEHEFEIMPVAEGRSRLNFKFADQPGLSIFLYAGRNEKRRLWPTITGWRWYHFLVRLGGAGVVGDKPVKRVTISYPSTASFLGFWGIDGWLVWLFLLAFASGFWAKLHWEIE